jgi:hypothetical protein
MHFLVHLAPASASIDADSDAGCTKNCIKDVDALNEILITKQIIFIIMFLITKIG